MQKNLLPYVICYTYMTYASDLPLLNLLIYKGQCLCVYMYYVCVFSIEIRTAGQIWMKFGMDMVLKGGKVLGGFQPCTPTPRYGVRKGGTGCLWSRNIVFW